MYEGLAVVLRAASEQLAWDLDDEMRDLDDGVRDLDDEVCEGHGTGEARGVEEGRGGKDVRLARGGTRDDEREARRDATSDKMGMREAMYVYEEDGVDPQATCTSSMDGSRGGGSAKEAPHTRSTASGMASSATTPAATPATKPHAVRIVDQQAGNVPEDTRHDERRASRGAEIISRGRQQLEQQQNDLEVEENAFSRQMEQRSAEHRGEMRRQEVAFADSKAHLEGDHGAKMATKWAVYRKAWEHHKALEQERRAGMPPTLTRHDTLMVGSSFNEDAAKDLSWRLLYGEVGLVHHGLDKLLGEPEVAAGEEGPLMAGMLHEHQECDDSHIWFAPTNYPIRTTSFLEWWVVVDPSDAQLNQVVTNGPGRCYRSLQEWPTAQRNATEKDAHLEAISTRGLPVSYFQAQWNLLNSRLATEAGEPPLQLSGFVCLRLYTGPVYVKYNAVLRGLPPGLDETPVADLAEQWSQLCLGNRYKVTLHAMTAAIGKLSRLTRVCTVYRGPGGVTPKSFWQSDQFGCVGGVEMALMSCSKDKKEALKYVRRSQAKVLFAVHQGMTARGAEISWLSTLSYLTLPYLTLPYLTLPCLALPYLTFYLTLPYLALPYLTLPYLALPYLALPCLTLPYLTLPYLTLPYLRCRDLMAVAVPSGERGDLCSVDGPRG